MASTNNSNDQLKLHYNPDWNKETEIGRGAFGMVFSAKVRRPGMFRYELCAVKRISKTNHMFPRAQYEREITNFARLVNVLALVMKLKYTSLTHSSTIGLCNFLGGKKTNIISTSRWSIWNSVIWNNILETNGQNAKQR
jgi:hypothetical protein